ERALTRVGGAERDGERDLLRADRSVERDVVRYERDRVCVRARVDERRRAQPVHRGRGGERMDESEIAALVCRFLSGGNGQAPAARDGVERIDCRVTNGDHRYWSGRSDRVAATLRLGGVADTG